MSDLSLESLLIETYPKREQGGQVCGGGQTGVKITHPSGLIAICDKERSQHKNRAIAMEMIMSGLTSIHYR